MSVCAKQIPVPFSTLGTAQVRDPNDVNFYNASLTITAPENRDVALTIDKISLDFNVFIDPGLTPDPLEFVAFKIVSRGKTILNRSLNVAETCALFSNNGRNVQSSKNSANTWDLLAQGCAIVLANIDDVVEIRLHTRVEVNGLALSASGCYRSKQDPEVCTNRVPFVEISSQTLVDGPDETKNSVSTLQVLCSAGHKREIRRIVLSGSDRFRDRGRQDNNYAIAVKSSDFTTFSGTISAEDADMLAPVTKPDDTTDPECEFQLWEFSCPLQIKSRKDYVNIVATDNDVATNPSAIPLVALGCQTLCKANH